MSYSTTLGDLQTLISEAHSSRVDEQEARSWAMLHIADLDSYDEVKDLAHHYGVPSVEVAHHATVKAQLLNKMVEEMLDFDDDYDDDDEYDDDDYDEWDVGRTGFCWHDENYNEEDY